MYSNENLSNDHILFQLQFFNIKQPPPKEQHLLGSGFFCNPSIIIILLILFNHHILYIKSLLNVKKLSTSLSLVPNVQWTSGNSVTYSVFKTVEKCNIFCDFLRINGQEHAAGNQYIFNQDKHHPFKTKQKFKGFIILSAPSKQTKGVVL